MANQISGKILIIENAVTIPTKAGSTFTKRQIVIDASHYDSMTGQKFENYPSFDFVGNRINDLDNFKVGDFVTISFALTGRPFEKDGKTTYFTSVNGYKIEPYQRQNNGSYPTPASQQANQVPQTAPQQNDAVPSQADGEVAKKDEDDLPF